MQTTFVNNNTAQCPDRDLTALKDQIAAIQTTINSWLSQFRTGILECTDLKSGNATIEYANIHKLDVDVLQVAKWIFQDLTVLNQLLVNNVPIQSSTEYNNAVKFRSSGIYVEDKSNEIANLVSMYTDAIQQINSLINSYLPIEYIPQIKMVQTLDGTTTNIPTCRAVMDWLGAFNVPGIYYGFVPTETSLPAQPNPAQTGGYYVIQSMIATGGPGKAIWNGASWDLITFSQTTFDGTTIGLDTNAALTLLDNSVTNQKLAPAIQTLIQSISGKANVNDVVTLFGDQSIYGIKTFYSPISITNGLTVDGQIFFNADPNVPTYTSPVDPNEQFNGSIYSTRATVQATVAQHANDTTVHVTPADRAKLAAIPNPPTTDGIWKLRCTVQGNITSYTWVPDHF